jgi:tRNA(adenine34) deaminase
LIIPEKQKEIGMQLAIREAMRAYDNDEVPIGAVVIKKGKVVGRGFNQRELLNDPTAHAEIIALTSAANTIGNWRLNDCELYVTKEPCPMCAGAIMNARISFVGFGVYDDEQGCCGSLYQLCNDPRFNHQSVVQGGLYEDDCKLIIQEYFNIKRYR